MVITKLFSILLAIGLTQSSVDDRFELLLPTPKNITIAQNGILSISKLLVCLPAKASRLKSAAKLWFESTKIEARVMAHEDCNKQAAGDVSQRSLSESRASFLESVDTTSNSAYVLHIHDDGINITSPSEEGLFYGLITLKQLVAQLPDSDSSGRSVRFDGSLAPVWLETWSAADFRGDSSISSYTTGRLSPTG